MTPEERQALERRISGLLDESDECLEGGCESYICRQDSNGMWRHKRAIEPWTTSEPANARLLEMMKHPLRYSAYPGYEGWKVDIGPTHLDRKIAVCLAFVSWFTSLSAEERAEVLNGSREH